MPRGRPRQPDELKALRGNPGKRRLATPKELRGLGAAPSAQEIMPAFLTQHRERELFVRIIDDYLQRRIARSSDANAYARYCAWLDRWWTCKEAIDGKTTWYESSSAHSKKLARRHPLFKDMMDIERVLESLEDRLGLNVVSRQAIIRGLATAPSVASGFGDKPADNQAGEQPIVDDRPPSPIGLGRLN